MREASIILKKTDVTYELPKSREFRKTLIQQFQRLLKLCFSVADNPLGKARHEVLS